MAISEIEGTSEVSYTYATGWSDYSAANPRTKIRRNKNQVIAQIYGIHSSNIANGDSITVLTLDSRYKPIDVVQTMGVGLTSSEVKGAVIAQINSSGELKITNITGSNITRVYVMVAYNIN